MAVTPGANVRRPSTKKRTIIFGSSAVAIVAVVVGALMFVKSELAATESDNGEAVVAREKTTLDPKNPPVFIELDAFTGNLAGDQREEAPFVQLVVSLRLSDPKAIESVKLLMPLIRNDILRVLAVQQASALQTIEGRDALQAKIKETVNEVIAPGSGERKSGNGPVRDVLFTSFIVQ